MSAAQAQFLPGTDANVPHNVTSSEFVYYRVYHNYGAIATKRPAYLDDIYIGRIRSKWVAPPHTTGSLRLCLSSMESINPNNTKLFASGSNQSALADEAPISLKSNQILGVIPEDPVILFSETMPQAEMQPGTESLRVAPESESPVAPRILFYGVYSEAGVRASKVPIDAEKPSSWVSKIDLYSIMPPVSVTSLLHILEMKEGINTSSRLLAQDGLTPLSDDQIFTKDGDWLGASAEDHIVLKFSPPFAEGSQYRIQNCCTGNSLAIWYRSSVEIASAGYYDDDPWKYFTLQLQDDGSVAFRNVSYGTWIGPNCCISGTKHGFWLIPSTTNKNYFFICEGDPVSRNAFYDPGPSDRHYYTLELRELDTTDTRQMWSLAQLQVSSQETQQCCCLVV